MRTLRFCVCLLVFVTVFIFVGCNKKGHGGKNFKQVSVTLSNCQANPDQVYDLHNGDKVDWHIPGETHDYTISFADQSEPMPNPFTVHHGVSNPHPINGNRGCTPEAGGHYCKYSLTMDNQSTPCKDPGLHVTP